MRRRKRMWLMWMLTGIWLCVQSPWAQAHAQSHMPAHLHAYVHVHATPLQPSPALEQHASHAPCPGAEHAPPSPSPPQSGDCCPGHCDGHCAQMSWAPGAVAPRLILREAGGFTPYRFAGPRALRQPELFRPPI